MLIPNYEVDSPIVLKGYFLATMRMGNGNVFRIKDERLSSFICFGAFKCAEEI